MLKNVVLKIIRGKIILYYRLVRIRSSTISSLVLIIVMVWKAQETGLLEVFQPNREWNHGWAHFEAEMLDADFWGKGTKRADR